MIALHRPQHLWVSPTCGPWSSWSHLNSSRSEEDTTGSWRIASISCFNLPSALCCFDINILMVGTITSNSHRDRCCCISRAWERFTLTPRLLRLTCAKPATFEIRTHMSLSRRARLLSQHTLKYFGCYTVGSAEETTLTNN